MSVRNPEKLFFLTLFADFGREGGRAKQSPGESTMHHALARMSAGVDSPEHRFARSALSFAKQKRGRRTFSDFSNTGGLITHPYLTTFPIKKTSCSFMENNSSLHLNYKCNKIAFATYYD